MILIETPPQITLCNEFMRNFSDSDLARIEVSPDEITRCPHGILRPLTGVPFETICNRFRVLSNLDPVTNPKTEHGRVKLSYRVNGAMKDIPLYLRFPPARTGFTVSKTPDI